MADNVPSQEELALRRRARRRLVGAIALALLAVLILPMVFDPEPASLDGSVDIRIPGQDTPFTTVPAPPSAPAVPTPPAVPEGQAAAPAPLPPVVPAETPAPTKADAQTMHAVPEPKGHPAGTSASNQGAAGKAEVKAASGESKSSAVKPLAAAKVEETKAAVKAKPAETKAPDSATPAAKPQTERKTKLESKPEPLPRAEAKPGSEGKAREDAKPASKSEPKVPEKAATYYLQLGAFSSESNARQLADRAKAAGIAASVRVDGGQSKVRVGPYATREAAVAAQSRLKDKNIGAVLVGP